jgi:DNA-binding NarL/FixJ family response regulator
VRLILADDAVLVREGLARLLAERGFGIVAQVGDGDELVERVARLRPDVAVIDIRMPPSYSNEGLVAAQQIRQAHPHTATLVLSQYVEVHYALKLLAGDSGRVGYLLKDRIADIDSFADSLRRVAAGETIVEPTLVEELLAAPHVDDPLAELTAREREVLALMAEGRTDRGISEDLFVTRKTVEAHVRSILRKLDLPDDARANRRVHAVLAFLRAQATPTHQSAPQAAPVDRG